MFAWIGRFFGWIFRRKPDRSQPLTQKQHAQRRYAAQMRVVRTKAKVTKGGKGRIAERSSAQRLRRKYGLKRG